MANMPEPARRAVMQFGLALTGSTMLLSLLFHFSANFAWLYRHAVTSNQSSSASAPLPDNSDRLSLATPDGPDGDEVWLPPAWSVPKQSAVPIRWTLAPHDRTLLPLPLLHPPAFLTTSFFAHL
jgi:hypothetical protein